MIESLKHAIDFYTGTPELKKLRNYFLKTYYVAGFPRKIQFLLSCPLSFGYCPAPYSTIGYYPFRVEICTKNHCLKLLICSKRGGFQ